MRFFGLEFATGLNKTTEWHCRYCKRRFKSDDDAIVTTEADAFYHACGVMSDRYVRLVKRKYRDVLDHIIV